MGEEVPEEVKAESDPDRQTTPGGYVATPGDTVRLRSGPYAGATGTVASVHPDKNYGADNSLVMVELANGRINSCYTGNLEMLKEAPNTKPPRAGGEGGKK